jgi:hypothetical protein
MVDGSNGAYFVGKLLQAPVKDSRVAATVIRTLLRSELEIGQACSAWPATSWNPAWSRPGSTLVTTSPELLTETPRPPSGPANLRRESSRCDPRRPTLGVAVTAIA